MSSIPGDFSKPTECLCYAALSPNTPIVPHKITRRAITENDVVIAIQYAGICHSDIHQVGKYICILNRIINLKG